MTDLEDRLRAGLRAEAQRTQPQHLRVLQVPARRGGGARRWLAPAAALVAVGLVATLIGVVAGGRLDPGPARSSPAASVSAPVSPPATSRPSPLPGVTSPAPSAAGWPPFYAAAGPSGSVVVRASGSGAVLGTVSVPGQQIVAVAASTADGAFVVAAHPELHTPTSRAVTSFYLFGINSSNRPSTLLKLPLTVQPGALAYAVGSMALSSDGLELAVSVVAGPGYQPDSPLGRLGHLPAGHSSLEVVSVATGAGTTWTAPASDSIEGLSWGSGATLGFTVGSLEPSASGSYQLRVLDTRRPAGALTRASRPVPLHAGGRILSALLTDDGRMAVAFTSQSPGAVLAEFSARTGQRLRVLAALPAGAQVGADGIVWSADPTGQHLLIGGGEAAGLTSSELPGTAESQPDTEEGVRVFGRMDGSRFTPLPQPAAIASQFAAW